MICEKCGKASLENEFASLTKRQIVALLEKVEVRNSKRLLRIIKTPE